MSETKTRNLALLRWPEVDEYLKTDDRIIIPLGSTEQHGPITPFGTDHLIPEGIAAEAALRSGALAAPTVAFGMSIHHTDFPGTMSLRATTLIMVFRDLLNSLHGAGFKRIVIINGHGGNRDTMGAGLSEICNELTDLKVKFRCWWELQGVKPLIDKHFGDREGHHGSPSETSQVMYLHPGSVLAGEMEFRRMVRSAYFPNRRRFREIYPNGLMGADPTLATEEIGRELFEQAVTGLCSELESWDEVIETSHV